MDKLKILQESVGKTFSESPSPFMRWLNPMVVSAAHGAVCFSYTVREEWLNPMGNLHGGVTAAIFDDIIGATMFSLNEKNFIVTVNNAIDYFSTAKENEEIIAETKIIKNGRQFVNAACEIWNADRSKLIAKGTSNLFKINNQV